MIQFDGTAGDLNSLGLGHGTQVVVLAGRDTSTTVPVTGLTFFIDPENYRFHDLLHNLENGLPDRRASIQVVLDYDGPRTEPANEEAPYQRELWTSTNRTTRFVEPGGNPALATSLLRVIDAEGKRFATALVSQTLNISPAGGGAGSAQDVTIPADEHDPLATVDLNGLFHKTVRKTVGADGRVTIDETGSRFSENRPPSAQAQPGTTRQKNDRPEGYLWSSKGKVGLLGTFFEPALSDHAYEVGLQGTPIGPLVARHDAQFGMPNEKPADEDNPDGHPAHVGPLAFSSLDATKFSSSSLGGKPIKGFMCRDESDLEAANANVDGATCVWRPVIYVNSDDIEPPAPLPGKPGPPGAPGKDGAVGPQGPQGPPGAKGGDGKDAGGQNRGGGSGVPCPNVPQVPVDPRKEPKKPRGQGNGGNVPFDPNRPQGPIEGGFVGEGGTFVPVEPSTGPITRAPGTPPDESGQGFPANPGWPGVTAGPGTVGLGGGGFTVPVSPGAPPKRTTPGAEGLISPDGVPLIPETVANFPILPLGQPGGAVSVGGQIALITAALEATRTQVNSLMGGPDYFAGNITAIHQNYPGFPPAGNTIGQWVQGGDEQVVVGPAASPLYALSILEGNVVAGDQRTAASRVTDARDGLLYSTGVFTVGREVGPGVTDYRPLIHLDNDRTQTGLVTAPLIETTDGSFGVTYTGGVISEGQPVVTYDPGTYVDGDVPTYDQATGTFVGTPGGSSGTDATSIQTVPVDPTAPTVGQTLVFDGTDWVPTTTFTIPPGYYGNGESGSHVLSGTDTLLGDMHATDVDLNGQILFTVGFKIYVSETSTFTFNGGSLNATGSGGQPGDIAGGGPGGPVQGSGTLGEDGLGGQGSQGAGGGLAGQSMTNCYGGAGGAGGDAGEPGFAGGTVSLPAAAYGRMQDYISGSTGVMTSRAGTIYMKGGAGGGGGGGQLGGGSGGGGGAGGQRLVLVAPRIVQGSAPGAVYCSGGNGGDGFISGGAVAGGGGGGGGGGDAVFIYEYTDCDLSDTGITDVQGGLGGAGVGLGANGAAGSPGRVTEMTR